MWLSLVGIDNVAFLGFGYFIYKMVQPPGLSNSQDCSADKVKSMQESHLKRVTMFLWTLVGKNTHTPFIVFLRFWGNCEAHSIKLNYPMLKVSSQKEKKRPNIQIIKSLS